MTTKLWKIKLEACGFSQPEAAYQARKLLDAMLAGEHTHGYTCGDMGGNAVGNWEEGPEVEDDDRSEPIL